jgi:hypothetical protein
MPEPPAAEDPLATLRTHVRSAQQAAERLARQAQRGPDERAQARPDPPRPPNGGTPPSGWHADDPESQASGELQALAELLESLRALLPDELREQVNDLVRQVLLVLRAIIDWMVGRLEREGPGREIEVEDIPIS